MMATATSASCIDQIGETAGQVWQKLDEDGPISISKLVGLIDAPRDTVMQAIGWLAREDKVSIEQTKRGRVVSLR
jgi:hypothetical protein